METGDAVGMNGSEGLQTPNSCDLAAVAVNATDYPCLICPTPNPACGGEVSGRPTQLQNLCQYPSWQGCDYPSYAYFTAGGFPCCMSTSSPIIIDVDGSGYNLTSASSGVLFDFFGSGVPVQIAWTAKGSTNGFLVRDLYGTGKIVSAREMFGNLTEQPPSEEPNGFAALSQYDDDGDGWIDENDSIWPSLLLWQDTNHNGVTDPGELRQLASLGIKRISVHDHKDRRVDQYGNLFRYQAAINDDSHDHRVYDVILQTNAAAPAIRCPHP